MTNNSNGPLSRFLINIIMLVPTYKYAVVTAECDFPYIGHLVILLFPNAYFHL